MISTNILGLAAVIGSSLLFSVDGKEVDKRVPVASPINHVRQVPTRRLYGGPDSGGTPTEGGDREIPSICEPGLDSGDNGVLWTEGQCEEWARDELGFTRFEVVNGVNPKGCFFKNDVAYWSQSDNLREISRPFDNGVKIRIYCETTRSPTLEPTLQTDDPTSFPTDYPTKWKDDGWDKDGWDGDGNGYCLTETGCHERAKELGVNFVIITGNYHNTYGCYFVLEDNNMYWNGGGNKADWSAKPNKGVRAYCDNENWGGDDWGGDDWGGDEHPTMEPSWKDDGHEGGGGDWAGDDWQNDAHPTIEPTLEPSAWKDDGYEEPTTVWTDDGYGGTLDPTGWTDDGYGKSLDPTGWTDDGYGDDDKGLKDDDTWTDDGFDDDDDDDDDTSGGGGSYGGDDDDTSGGDDDDTSGGGGDSGGSDGYIVTP